MDDSPLTAVTISEVNPFDVLFVPQKVKYYVVFSQMPCRNSSLLHQCLSWSDGWIIAA